MVFGLPPAVHSLAGLLGLQLQSSCCRIVFAVIASFFLLFGPSPAVHSLADLLGLQLQSTWCRRGGDFCRCCFCCCCCGGVFFANCCCPGRGVLFFCCCCRGGCSLFLLIGSPRAVDSLTGLPGLQLLSTIKTATANKKHPFRQLSILNPRSSTVLPVTPIPTNE